MQVGMAQSPGGGKRVGEMKVLIACEESQTVCKAFRARGHEAYSCDIQEPSGGGTVGIIQARGNPGGKEII